VWSNGKGLGVSVSVRGDRRDRNRLDWLSVVCVLSSIQLLICKNTNAQFINF